MSTPARTRTGGFPIGLRRMWFGWQKDLDATLDWAQASDLSVIDLGKDADVNAPNVLKRGMRLGSVDLAEFKGMISPDKAVRDAAVAKNIAHIETCAKYGPLNFFTVMLPQKPELPRKENFGYMVETYAALAPALAAAKANIVIEGWPGPGALCCTPEGYGRFFAECSAPAFGVNYDPSHLIRMGIDPLRFLREFIGRVHHVHGKDCEILTEGLYQYGNTQEATFGKERGFGGLNWRYTIPGHGLAPWAEILRLLVEAKYPGAISIELEDEVFDASEADQKTGYLYARDNLRSY